jgi:hypothetical protein
MKRRREWQTNTFDKNERNFKDFPNPLYVFFGGGCVEIASENI